MSDRDHRAAVGAQAFLQPVGGGPVEVVRRFVEEQQLGARGEDAREGEPRLLAAGERADAALVRDMAEAEPVQRGVHPGVGLVAAPLLVAGGEFPVREEFLG